MRRPRLLGSMIHHSRFLSAALLAAYLGTAGAAVAGSAPAARPSLARLYKPSATPPAASSLVTTASGTVHLDAKHYKSVRDGALAMMKRYPPANNFYLALGRSPVSMFTFLQALDSQMTSTFPASDLRLGIQPAHHPLYFQHFEHYIPAEVLRGERGNIVLFDRSHDKSGSSLARLKPLLEQYIASKGYKTKVVALGFAAAGPLQAGVDYISTRSFPHVFIYDNGVDGDEAVAPYLGKHTIGQHAVGQLEKNPEHGAFKKAMKERMANDAELDELLKTEPHLTEVAGK